MQPCFYCTDAYLIVFPVVSGKKDGQKDGAQLAGVVTDQTYDIVDGVSLFLIRTVHSRLFDTNFTYVHVSTS